MAAVKSKNSKSELTLRKALWAEGLRYRIHVRKIIGVPDIVFFKKKLAIFVDSEFWHGKKYIMGQIPKVNTEFWIKKLERNIARDIEVSKTLTESGWTVLRFWETDVLKSTSDCVVAVKGVLFAE